MKKSLLAMVLLLCASIATGGEVLFTYLSGDPVMLAYADMAKLGDGVLKERFIKLNKELAARAGGQYDFSKMADQFDAAVFSFDGDFAGKNQLTLVRGSMQAESFFEVLARSVNEPLTPATLNGRPMVIFPKRALNRKLRERMELSAAFIADDLVFIGARANAVTLAPTRGEETPARLANIPEAAFAKFYFRPDPVLPYSFLFGGVNEAVVSAEPYGTGGLKLVGRVTCASDDIAGKLAGNLKQLLTQLIIIAMHKDMLLAAESASKLVTSAESGGTVRLELPLDGGLAKRVIDYAAANVPVK